jgi:hypothetical protein
MSCKDEKERLIHLDFTANLPLLGSKNSRCLGSQYVPPSLTLLEGPSGCNSWRTADWVGETWQRCKALEYCRALPPVQPRLAWIWNRLFLERI